MTTFLPQNQYFPNSVAQPPGSVAADTAAAPPQPPGAAAGTISFSDGAFCGSLPSGEIGLPVMSAGAPSESLPTSSTGGPQRAPAGRAPNTATPPGALVWDINGTENIHEIFDFARKLCREQSPDIADHRFVPDYAGMYQVAIDDDPLPLFLQRAAE